ncbi:YlbD family protein [Bacillus sp. DTU_2020_1000418_1_SI_GHA_SEK_038]|uniref:YlbD family protein n=1 Tax=Bacillus sp. DTU_2020_1000418_1_SI_GHA_SEK_038 TaxID=3077585 RepID=UPI0028F15017|nr:YlbD family protein [Bacillus sp. DTU_2020_1000418_1_SI_GHA_SEK_038]WNS77053.1 YlbD family protein [Bacillus sp. DTU_2020_1000418_1_SI_GHA_SEK_038]
MTKKKLHPSILQFKEFVKKNPKIVLEVRTGKKTWQELYEDWYLLGEDDPKWENVRSEEQAKSSTEEKKSDWMSQILGSIKKMDPNQVQGYIHNLNQALSAVQGVLSQFQGGNQQQKLTNTNQPPPNPFKFKKD